MELNIREEKLRNLFKQFQVEHNENCETVFIDNNDEHLENYLNESNTVYLHMVDYEVRHLDKKGAYYKDKDMMIYQKELASNFDKDLFLVKYMASELKGNSEMTSLYRGVNQ